MESRNRLNEVPLANVDNKDLTSIKDLEKELGDKYYLIAFDKTKEINFK